MFEVLSTPAAQRLTLVLLHFVWQGALVAPLLWGVLNAGRVRTAAGRYLWSLAALVSLAACPAVTWCVVDVPAAARPTESIASPAAGAGVAQQVPHDAAAAHALGSAAASSSSLGEALQAVQPQLLLGWLLGVHLLGLRLLVGYASTRWMRRQRFALPDALRPSVERLAQRLRVDAADRVFVSRRAAEAVVVGFVRPIVLLPMGWINQMPLDVLEAVLAHELAHIRRYDMWATLLQRVVETALFYHPAVWWVSRRMSLEREMCCDEAAVRALGCRVSYARALEAVGRRSVGIAPAVSAVGFTGDSKMNLLRRVRNVLGSATTLRSGNSWPAGVCAVMLLAVAAAVFGLVSAAHSTVVADDALKGDRPAEAADAPRRSPEADAPRRAAEADAPRRSAEADAPRRSAEADAPRRSPEADAPRRPAEGDTPRRPAEGQPGTRPAQGSSASDFRPQTPREAALYNIILQLQREVAELRRQLNQLQGGEGTGVVRPGVRPRDGEGTPRPGARDGEGTPKPGLRDGERPAKPGARDGEGPAKPGPRDGDAPAKPGPRDGDRA
jgi:beta-lactamase regulating signal transducer with metallopeptidase domain